MCGDSLPILKPLVWLILLAQPACQEAKSNRPLHSLLDGTWWTACIARQDWFASYRLELNFLQDHAVSRREHYFADSDCTDPRADLIYSGEYSLMVTSKDSIYGIDLLYADQELQALNTEGSALLQQTSFCGQVEWLPLQAQVPVNFDRTQCTAVGPVPLKNLNLVRVDRGRSLEFGIDLADENERPLDISPAQPALVFLSQQPH